MKRKIICASRKSAVACTCSILFCMQFILLWMCYTWHTINLELEILDAILPLPTKMKHNCRFTAALLFDIDKNRVKTSQLLFHSSHDRYKTWQRSEENVIPIFYLMKKIPIKVYKFTKNCAQIAIQNSFMLRPTSVVGLRHCKTVVKFATPRPYTQSA